jgi:hypothetical protein
MNNIKQKLLIELSDKFQITSLDIRDYLIENNKQTTADVSASLNNLKKGDIFL